MDNEEDFDQFCCEKLTTEDFQALEDAETAALIGPTPFR